MIFRWDPEKAVANRKKHGVDFHEAATVLDDPLSTTFPDPAHSRGEHRFLTIGMSKASRLLVVAHTEEEERRWFGSLPPGVQRAVSEGSMKRVSRTTANDMRSEYDFSSMKGGVRGKYVRRYRAGTNLVLIERDLVEAFPDDASVNAALRAAVTMATLVQGHKRRANRRVQPTSRTRRRATGRSRSRAARG